MKHPRMLVAVGLVSLVSCSQDPILTAVSCTVTNQYTRQPVANLKLEVSEVYTKGLFNEGIRTILEGQTDSGGHYQVHFDAKSNNTYSIQYDGNYYDLTPGHHASRTGIILVGKANVVDFSVTPPIPVRVDVDAQKNGVNFLRADFFGTDSADGSSSNVFVDTALVNQHVQGVYPTLVWPNRHYQFTLLRATLIHHGLYDFQTVNPTYTYYERFIGYNDTTVIRLH